MLIAARDGEQQDSDRSRAHRRDRSAPSAATAEPAAQEVADEGSGTAGLSAAAAELEEKSRLRRERAARAPAYAGPEAAEPAAREAPAETAQATAPQRVAALVKPTPRKSYSPRSPRNERRATHSGPLLMHVHNTLGRDQQREQLTLMIEGKRVADIEVDDFAPEASIAIELPRPGLLHYRLEGVSEDDRTMRLVGEGCIRVRDGARFAVRRKDGSRKVFLEQQSGRAG